MASGLEHCFPKLPALVSLVVAGAVLAGCASRPPSFDDPPRETRLTAPRVELPAMFDDGCPSVNLKVNGKGPYRFLVDTGAEGTAITGQVARDAGVSPSRKFAAQVWGSSGDSERQRVGVVDRLEAPGLVLTGVNVTILTPESAALLGPAGETPSGGIIGLSAFREVRLEIDYPGRKVRMFPLDDETLPAGAGVVYTGTRPQVTIVTPAPGNQPVTVVVDTGSQNGWVLADITAYPVRVGLVKADAYDHGIGGYRRALFGQLAGDIRLGSAIWRDPEIRSGPENLMGSRALADWKLVIDQQSKRLWLLEENQINMTTWTGPLEPDGRPSVYGFTVARKGDDFVIMEVDAGSRADRAGLKVGDRILGQTNTLDSGNPLESDPHRAQLDIARGNQKLKITLSLSEPLPTSVGQ